MPPVVAPLSTGGCSGGASLTFLVQPATATTAREAMSAIRSALFMAVLSFSSWLNVCRGSLNGATSALPERRPGGFAYVAFGRHQAQADPAVGRYCIEYATA